MTELLLGANASNMVDFNQRNPHHCFTLFSHCLYTVDCINSEREKIMTDADLLRTAGLFHDIAKPDVAVENEGRLVFYGHAKKSAEFAQNLLPKLGFRSEEIQFICFLIAHHDDFISYVLPDEEYDKENVFLIEITKENVLKHIEETLDDTLLTVGSCIHEQYPSGFKGSQTE